MPVYKIRVTMTVQKDYTVSAENDEEAYDKLVDSGIVKVKAEKGRPEKYNEDYDVIGTVDNVDIPDVD